MGSINTAYFSEFNVVAIQPQRSILGKKKTKKSKDIMRFMSIRVVMVVGPIQWVSHLNSQFWEKSMKTHRYSVIDQY